MGDLYNQPVVLDNGLGTLRAGFAGEDIPKLYGPLVVGRPKYQKIMVVSDDGASDNTYIGDRARSKRGLLRLSYPLDHGQVVNWSDMTKVWQLCYSDHLKVSADDHPVLITEAPLNPRRNRDKMAEVLFEQMNVPCLYVLMPAVLLLYAQGRTTGVVVDVGHGVLSVVPVFDGFALPTAMKRMDVAGNDVTDQLAFLVNQALGTRLLSLAELDVVRQLKEATAMVALDPIAEEKRVRAGAYASTTIGASSTGTSASSSAGAVTYTLPDGQRLAVGAERFRAPEILFRPDIIGDELPGLATMVATAIAKCDLDLRATLWNNVVVLGGLTLMPGFGDRLLSDVRQRQSSAGADTKVRLLAPPERTYLAWIGGLILGALLSFRKMWVTAAEYHEHPDAIHTRCV